ncbi:MAG: hypothetical protein ACLP1X_33770 [Polyangiaceae bacterium]
MNRTRPENLRKPRLVERLDDVEVSARIQRGELRRLSDLGPTPLRPEVVDALRARCAIGVRKWWALAYERELADAIWQRGASITPECPPLTWRCRTEARDLLRAGKVPSRLLVELARLRREKVRYRDGQRDDDGRGGAA